MGIYDFHILSTNDQANEAWTNGTFLCSRSNGVKKYNLYSLSDFFVEMLYDSRNNEIKKIKSFRSERLLKPYLSQIKLKDILKTKE